jgi:hypothetical protein
MINQLKGEVVETKRVEFGAKFNCLMSGKKKRVFFKKNWMNQRFIRRTDEIPSTAGAVYREIVN